MALLNALGLSAQALRRRLISPLVMLFCLFSGSAAYAHSPHDVIKSVAVSPWYKNDSTVFINVHDELKRSTDSGASWQNLERGLDNNTLISDIVTAAGEPGQYRVFAATHGDGIYVSDDSGDSWHAIADQLKQVDIQSLALSPAYFQDQTLAAVAANGTLYVSTDAGNSWQQVAENRFVASTASMIMRDESLHLVVGDTHGGMHISADDFRHWPDIGAIAGAGKITTLSALAIDRGEPTLYIGTESSGLYKTADFGASFTPVPISTASLTAPSSHITSVAAIQRAPERAELLVTTWDEAAFQSTDGGETWTYQPKGIDKTSQADEYHAPHFYELALPPLAADEDLIDSAFIGGFAGLFRYEADGSWTQMETRPVRNIEGLVVSESLSGQQLVALASYDAGAYISTDSGASWKTRNIGLRSTHLWDIAVSESRQQENAIFTVSNISFLSSLESDSSWRRNEIAASMVWKLLAENFDEGSLVMRAARRFLERPGFTFPTQIGVSPAFASDGTIYLGTRRQGLFKSKDRGASWTKVWSADKGWVGSLKLSPDFTNDGVIAASLRRKGFYLSTDAGQHWSRKINGISESAIAYKGLGSSVVQFSPNFKADNTLYFGSADGLYVSKNRGDAWERIPVTSQPVREHIKTVALSPGFVNDGTMIVSVKGHGLYKSTDHGRTFREIAPQLMRDNSLLKLVSYATDFADSHTVFGASAEEVYISSDAGENWEKLKRPVRYEDNKDNFVYMGEWKTTSKNTYSALSLKETRDPGSSVEVRIFGEAFTWYGPKSKEYGEASVYIDGNFAGKASQYSDEPIDSLPVYTHDGLARQEHTIRIVNTENEEKDSGPYIAIDAIEVD